MKLESRYIEASILRSVTFIFGDREPFIGQNGFDNGGMMPEEVDFVLSALERLAQRYGERKGLWGIQILNEPMLEKAWEFMHVQERNVPVK